MQTPDNLLYTKEHEWIRIEGAEAYIGITNFAQEQLGDIVFIEIETEGETLDREDIFGTIEAVKAVSDMFMPISGEILSKNEMINENPAIVNTDPYGEGWILKIKILKPEEINDLLSADEYKKLI